MALLRAARSFRVPGFGEPVTFKSTTYLQTRSFIQLKTKLQVADNSGAKRVECIKVVGGGKGAKIGDIIIASVKEITHRVRSTRKGDTKDGNKVKKGDVVYGVVVRGAMQRPRSDGSQIKFEENAVVLINKQGEPIGTRVFGPVAAELRERKLVKVLALAEHVV